MALSQAMAAMAPDAFGSDDRPTPLGSLPANRPRQSASTRHPLKHFSQPLLGRLRVNKSCGCQVFARKNAGG